MKDDFMTDTPLLFRCNVSFEDIATGEGLASARFLDYTDPVPPNGGTLKRLLGEYIYRYLRLGPLTGSTLEYHDTWNVTRRSFEYDSAQLFHYGIGRLNTTLSELWLASYIVNSLGNKLQYLNEILRRIEIEAEVTRIRTTLEVKWRRVVGILGGLLIFQILFASVGLWYCHGSMEFLDEVRIYSDMLGEFSFESEQSQAGKREVYGGKTIGDTTYGISRGR